jgi:hypothetical protein
LSVPLPSVIESEDVNEFAVVEPSMMLMPASAVVTVSIPAPSVVVAVATTAVDVSLTVVPAV